MVFVSFFFSTHGLMLIHKLVAKVGKWTER